MQNVAQKGEARLHAAPRYLVYCGSVDEQCQEIVLLDAAEEVAEVDL